jgi:hypothetical protein
MDNKIWTHALADQAMTELYADYKCSTPRRDIHCSYELERLRVAYGMEQALNRYKKYVEAAKAPKPAVVEFTIKDEPKNPKLIDIESRMWRDWMEVRRNAFFNAHLGEPHDQ